MRPPRGRTADRCTARDASTRAGGCRSGRLGVDAPQTKTAERVACRSAHPPPPALVASRVGWLSFALRFEPVAACGRHAPAAHPAICRWPAGMHLPAYRGNRSKRAAPRRTQVVLTPVAMRNGIVPPDTSRRRVGENDHGAGRGTAVRQAPPAWHRAAKRAASIDILSCCLVGGRASSRPLHAVPRIAGTQAAGRPPPSLSRSSGRRLPCNHTRIEQDRHPHRC